METLDQLCVALGFATLAWLNLYLVVLITGLAIQQQWVVLDAPYEQLAVLGEPTVIIAAGAFFVLEFFSDKIPWVDSLWDSVHSLIRPVGGGVLAIQTLGQADPAFIVITAMLAGGTTAITHGFKAGNRLAINTSPEPFTNIGASLTEDIAVMGGLALMAFNPVIAAITFTLFLGFALYVTPKLFRRSRAFLWLLGRRVGLRGTAQVATGRSIGFGMPANLLGKLAIENSMLSVTGRRLWREKTWTIHLDESLEFTLESRTFSEDLAISCPETNRRWILRFPRRAAAKAALDALQKKRPLALDAVTTIAMSGS